MDEIATQKGSAIIFRCQDSQTEYYVINKCAKSWDESDAPLNLWFINGKPDPR